MWVVPEDHNVKWLISQSQKDHVISLYNVTSKKMLIEVDSRAVGTEAKENSGEGWKEMS